MSYNFYLVTSLILLGGPHQGDTSRILGVFPTAAISHQVGFRGLTLELNKRGHELVVLTTDPVKNTNLKNYTEIDVSFLYNQRTKVNFIHSRERTNPISLLMELLPSINSMTETILDYPELKKVYASDSNEKFDLILVEMFVWPAFLALSKRFDAPVIGMSSLGLMSHLQYDAGNPILSSHPSVWELMIPVTEPLSTWQRLHNFIRLWKTIHFYKTDFVQKQDAIARKFFGDEIPNLRDLERNVSLIFENQQEAIAFNRPSVPKVIKIGGFHISKNTEPLAKDLEKILDEATQGFVYMSLGSNVRSSMLSNETRAEFMAAFAELPYLVIWKFEDELLPGKPDNVIIMKWTPQQAILAHPNLKVFIYQGGLQSTEEAISYGVPLIGFPVIGDQDMQINKMVSLGVAKKLEILSVNKDDLLDAVRTVVLDSGYKERMLNLRSLIKDNPQDAMETAIWWTEFVIRHRGAPHLQSTTAEEPWYTRQDMDIIALITAGSVILLLSTIVISYKTLSHIIKILSNSSVIEKKKRN